MSKVIPIAGEAIRVLFLCSYDKGTLEVVESVIDEIRRIYDPRFQRRLLPLLAKNLRIFEARSEKERYFILSEKYGERWSISVFENGEIVDNLECDSAEHDAIMKLIEDSIRGVGEYREMMATTKVMELCKWSDLIAVVKHKGLGRGGELVELAMIACSYLFVKDPTFVQKTVLLRKSKVRLSWMMKELIELGRIREKVYKDYSSLLEGLKEEVDRLTEIKRFT